MPYTQELHPAALQELAEREGGDFPLTSDPANHTAGDLKSNPFQANQRWWWAHTSSRSGLWFADVGWHCDGSSLCSSHGSLCHPQKQAGSQAVSPVWELRIEKKIAVLVLWHLPHIRTIINYSQPQQCVPRSEAMCVWLRVCICQCVHSVCGHDMLSSDLWGTTFPRLLSESAFLLGFQGHGLVSVDIRRAGTWCFTYGL